MQVKTGLAYKFHEKEKELYRVKESSNTSRDVVHHHPISLNFHNIKNTVLDTVLVPDYHHQSVTVCYLTGHR